jgi:hypothetical protein
MKDLRPQDRKKNYTKMKSEDFKAIIGLLFEEKRPLVTYKILGETRRIPEK